MARIILAEDDDAMRQFITSSLKKCGHDVHAFSDGAQAHEALLSSSFDMLLTDVVMPKMDGIELSKHAKKLYPSISIVFITGFAASLSEAKDNDSTGTRVISKPFHLGRLTQEINDILSKKL